MLLPAPLAGVFGVFKTENQLKKLMSNGDFFKNRQKRGFWGFCKTVARSVFKNKNRPFLKTKNLKPSALFFQTVETYPF